MSGPAGITLVALVVTIIVLLILAGVSINLVAGSNGILGKATKAVDITNMAQIKEEIELKIAELQMDYYMKDNNFANVNDYVKAELEKGVELSNGAEIRVDSSGKLSYEGLEIGSLNPDGSVTIDGELSGNQIVQKYTASYNANGGQGGPSSKKYAAGESVTVDFTTKPTKKGANFLGWATSSTATTPEYTTSGSFTMGSQSVILYAVWEKLAGTAAIKPEYYGDKVNYSANGVNDWKVFLNDGNSVYLITGDWVEGSKLNLATGISINGNYVYVPDQNRNTLVDWIKNKIYWTNFVNEYAEQANGGPTLAQLAYSANGKLGTSYDENTIQRQTLNNDFYQKNNNCWLPDPDSSATNTLNVWGNGGFIGWHRVHDSLASGIRPIVQLKSNAKMSWNGTAWDLSN